ncbi:MAG: hypothetical protein DMG85_18585 [Acidobacteria bacterium]|nr:MAG: hypothetical protein DMG85_18585 [Acidobacteriota bacterium]
MGQVADGTKVGVKLKFFPQRHVNAGKPASDGSRDRTLEPNPSAFDGFDQLFGDVFVIFLIGFGARLESFPFKFQTGGFEDAHCGASDFRTNAIAGNESDLVCH